MKGLVVVMCMFACTLASAGGLLTRLDQAPVFSVTSPIEVHSNSASASIVSQSGTMNCRCEGPSCPTPVVVQPAVVSGYLQIDDLFYALTDEVQLYAGFIIASGSTAGECRRVSNGASTITEAAALVGEAEFIYLKEGTNVSVFMGDMYSVTRIVSSDGDIVCNGSVPPPLGFAGNGVDVIYRNGMESQNTSITGGD